MLRNWDIKTIGEVVISMKKLVFFVSVRFIPLGGMSEAFPLRVHLILFIFY